MPRIDIYADLKPAELNAVGLAMFKIWTEFALGQRRLGGRKLKQPTGTYASALRFEASGKNHVAVIVDEGKAPHAKVIEHGHRQVDLLDHVAPGRAIPMYRTQFSEVPGGSVRFNINPQTGKRGRAVSAGVMRSGGFVPTLTGIVRAPKSRSELAGRRNTSGRGPAWTIPAMPAYSPARLIAQLFAKKVSEAGGQIGYTG